MRASPIRRIVCIVALVGLGVVVAVGVGTIAGAVQAGRQGEQPGGGARLLAAEIEAMEAGGARPDDPKLQLLEDDLAALERGQRLTPPREPDADVDLDVGAVLGDPATALREAGSTADHAVDTSDARLWDDGTVQCEVVPPDLLTAADIAGATCTSTIDAQGTGRYTAVAPDGTARTVVFAPDGSVTREPDRHP